MQYILNNARNDLSDKRVNDLLNTIPSDNTENRFSDDLES